MALSNTATPKYYGEFRDAVLRGEIPVCETISMQMVLIDELIANPDFYYDDTKVEGWIKFCENEMTLTDGSPVTLLPSFKLWGEDVFGWYYFVEKNVWEPNPDGFGGRYVRRTIKKRLRNKQYLIVARGGAKSIYDSFIQGHGLTVDTSTTHGITTAPTMRQADEVMSPIATAIIVSRGPLFKFLTDGSTRNTSATSLNKPKLITSKKGIENKLTNSVLEIRPMSINKLQGLRCKYATVDEWLSGDLKEDPIGAIEQGASKVKNYLIVASSSEGTVRNGAGDTIKMELMAMLKGEYYNPHTSIWYYRLDNIEEVAHPELWIKANPNLGKTVDYETYQLDVERAEKNPAARNDILAKRFGLPLEGFTYFFPYNETLPRARREYHGMECALGADMSQGDDFCSFCFLFPLPTGDYGIRTRSYITGKTLNKLPAAMRIKYEEFIEEGSLIIFENDVTIDMDKVYDDLNNYIVSNDYVVCCFGYDPYNADKFVNRWTIENSPFGVEKVIQGKRTETVPLGEIKKLSEYGMLWFDENVFSFAMGNCITIEDNNGQRMLMKKRYECKIDPVAAMMDAYIAYGHNRDAF